MNGKKRLPTTTSCFTELNRYMVMKWMALPLLCLTMDISRTSVVRSPTQSHTYFYRFVFWNDSSDYKALQYCKLVDDSHAYCSWHGASWLVGTWWMSNGWRHHVGMGKAEMMQNTWHTCLSYCLMGTSQAFFQGSLFEPPAHIAPHCSISNCSITHLLLLPLLLFNTHSLTQVCMFGLPSWTMSSLRDGNNVPQISVASRPSMEPDTGCAGKHCTLWQPQRCTAQLHLQENLLQEHGWLTASRCAPLDHRTFPPRPHFPQAAAG